MNWRMIGYLGFGGIVLLSCGFMGVGVFSAGDAWGDWADEERAVARAWVEEAFAEPEEAPSVRDGLVVEHQRNELLFNRTVWDTPLTLGGKAFERGVYMDAEARLRVIVGQPARAFTAVIGIDENSNTKEDPERGSARFRVSVREERVYSSPVLKLADGGTPINVPLNGAREFVIEADDGGDGIGWDQCDWGDAAVVMNDGTKRFLDDFPLLKAGERRSTPPFSFTYDGKPSEGFIGAWDYEVHEKRIEGRDELLIAYTDPKTGVRIECVVTTYPDASAVDWVCFLANEGAEDTPLIENFMPLDAALPKGDASSITLRWSKGDDCCPDAFLPYDEALEAEKPRRFTPYGGRSSNHTFPFWNLMGQDGGWVFAIGWTGQWVAEFTAHESGGVSVRAGMETTRFRLQPGERVRTPRIVLLRWQGDDPLRGHNLFRKLMLDHYVPHRDGKPAPPPIAHNTAATIYQTGKPTNEANQLAMIEQAADAGCEGYWLDAYWYPQPWHAHVGDWYPRPEDFPRGLKPLSDAAHARGMKFILWFEPERVREGTQWDKEHPEFLLKREGESNRLLNLGDPKACDFLIDFIDRRIREWGIDLYRQDFNFEPLPYWQANDAEERQGITEVKYVEGLYRFWDTIVERNPAITIDNCASGGRRIDIETCSRSYPLWRSDRNDIGEGLKGEAYWPYMGMADQIHGTGLGLYVPFHAGPVWDERPYTWRSAMSAGIGLYGDIEKFEPTVTAQAIEELKELRPLFLGDLCPLAAITMSQRNWYAYQLDRPDLGEGCAVFFRRPDSPYPSCEITLHNIAPGATYEISVTGETYDKGAAREVSGETLAGMEIRIDERPGSLILRYRRSAGGTE